MIPNLLAAALSLAAAAVLLSGLVRLFTTMRQVAHDLDTVRLLLRTVANRTEPVKGWVDQIGENVVNLSTVTEPLAARTHARIETSGGSLPGSPTHVTAAD